MRSWVLRLTSAAFKSSISGRIRPSARALRVMGVSLIALVGPLAIPAYSLDHDNSVLTVEREISAEDSDSRFLEVSRKVPEFGGAYIKNGSLYIWLTRQSDEIRDRARSALLEAMGDDFRAENAIALRAAYSFQELHAWSRAARDVLGVNGVILMDVDERVNRLVVEVEDTERHEAQVEAELSRSGVPRQAVNIVKGEPVRSLESDGRRFWFVSIAVVVVALAILLLSFVRRRRAGRSEIATSGVPARAAKRA